MGRNQLSREVIPLCLRIYCSLCVWGSDFQLAEASLAQMLIRCGANKSRHQSSFIYVLTHVHMYIETDMLEYIYRYTFMCVCVCVCVCSACIQSV